MVENLLKTPETPFTSHKDAAQWLLSQLVANQEENLPELQNQKKSKEIVQAKVGAPVYALQLLRKSMNRMTGGAFQLPDRIVPVKTDDDRHPVDNEESDKQVETQKAVGLNLLLIVTVPISTAAIEAWQQALSDYNIQPTLVSITIEANKETHNLEYVIQVNERKGRVAFTDKRIFVPNKNGEGKGAPLSLTELAFVASTLPEVQEQLPEGINRTILLGSQRLLSPQLEADDQISLGGEDESTPIAYDPAQFSFYQIHQSIDLGAQ
jgi:hypothetical protein